MSTVNMDKSGKDASGFGLVIVDSDDALGPHLHLTDEGAGAGNVYLTFTKKEMVLIRKWCLRQSRRKDD